MLFIKDPDLGDVLTGADIEDLAILIDHITDKGEGRISLSSDVCRKLAAANLSGRIDHEARAYVAEELQRFGGNSLVNLLRGGSGVSYKEIVCDVAEHVKAPFTPRNDCSQIEIAILMKVLEQSLDKMSEEQKRKLFDELGTNYTVGAGPAAMASLLAGIRLSGFGAYKLTAVVANATVNAILGRGLTFGASAGMMRGIGGLAGPIGWAITAIWTAFDLASPAYRVTVPCVIQIAYMRQKAFCKRCPNCHAAVPQGAKFCSDCGNPIERLAALPNAN